MAPKEYTRIVERWKDKLIARYGSGKKMIAEYTQFRNKTK